VHSLGAPTDVAPRRAPGAVRSAGPPRSSVRARPCPDTHACCRIGRSIGWTFSHGSSHWLDVLSEPAARHCARASPCDAATFRLRTRVTGGSFFAPPVPGQLSPLFSMELVPDHHPHAHADSCKGKSIGWKISHGSDHWLDVLSARPPLRYAQMATADLISFRPACATGRSAV